ncbi:hypothetical protein ScPMuIL_013407 [Solemya velum]
MPMKCIFGSRFSTSPSLCYNMTVVDGFIHPALTETLIRCPNSSANCPTLADCTGDPQRCRLVKDCGDDSSEKYCRDSAQDMYWNLKFKKRPDADWHIKKNVCALHSVPRGCNCKDGTNVYCTNVGMTNIPKVPTGTTLLDLSGNLIQYVAAKSLSNLPNLTEILLVQNNIVALKSNSFSCCPGLTKLYLLGNRIKVIEPGAFNFPNKIQELALDRNQLTVLEPAMFSSLHNLKELYLSGNGIADIRNGSFSSLKNLVSLSLSSNKLSYIKDKFFEGLKQLTFLLHISQVEWQTPHKLEKSECCGSDYQKLKSPSLTYTLVVSFFVLSKFNRVSKYEAEYTLCVMSLTSSSYISTKLNIVERQLIFIFMVFFYLNRDLRRNKIWHIDTDAFQSLTVLRSLELRQNEFRRLESDTISRLLSLEYVYFDEFYMCSYAPQVQRCQPRGNGISSHHNLLENMFLRVCVWVVAAMACAGNSVVIFGRFLLREDNQIHSFYIKNLSLADMLMGIYLFVIGSRDMMYRGEYLKHDEQWRASWGCDVCGIISTLSSEVSVLTIALITFDRYISIMYPFYLKKRNLKLAVGIMMTIWGVCLVLTVLPVSGIPYFGHSFYNDNGVCIPLHLHNPTVRGWEYSTFLILGLNLMAFLFISYAYIVMFMAIRKSTTALHSMSKCQERSFIKRFFFIVVTDFVCWIPIIVIKLITLCGVRVNGELYGWIVVFILPVNSALNPLLYTLTTRLYKEKLLPRFCVFFRRKKRPAYKEKSSSCTPVRNSISTADNVARTDHPQLAVQTLVTCCATERRSGTPGGEYQIVKVTIFLKILPE